MTYATEQDSRPAQGLTGLIQKIVKPGFIDTDLSAIVMLGIRLYIARIFYNTGIVRVNSWDSQEFLFMEIHPVPYLAPSLAAPITTFGEIALAVAFAFGFLGRLSGLGLLIMAMVIQFVVAQTPQGIDNGIGNNVHYLWMLLCLIVAVNGPGKLSVDRLIWNRIR